MKRHLSAIFSYFLLFSDPAQAQAPDFVPIENQTYFTAEFDRYGSYDKTGTCIRYGQARSVALERWDFVGISDLIEHINQYGWVEHISYNCNYDVLSNVDELIRKEVAQSHAHCLRPGYLHGVREVCKTQPVYECPATTDMHLQTQAGNPISLTSGRKFEYVTDWSSPLDARFRFERVYSSGAQQMDATTKGWGAGWSSPWLRQVTGVSPGQIRQSEPFKWAMGIFWLSAKAQMQIYLSLDKVGISIGSFLMALISFFMIEADDKMFFYHWTSTLTASQRHIGKTVIQ